MTNRPQYDEFNKPEPDPRLGGGILLVLVSLAIAVGLGFTVSPTIGLDMLRAVGVAAAVLGIAGGAALIAKARKS